MSSGALKTGHAFQTRGLRAYGIALAGVGAGTLVRFLLDPWVGDHAPFMIFAFVVVAAAHVGGFKAGIAATIVSVFVSDYFFVPPRYTFFLHDPRGDLIMLIIFAALGIALSAIVERLRQTMFRFEEANRLLESKGRYLQAANERFRMATEVANEAIWERDVETGAPACTDSYATRFGSSDGDYAEWILERIHPEDRERVRHGMQAAINGSEARWDLEYRLRLIDGVWADVRDRASIARNSEGKAMRIVGAILDVTAPKRMQQELEQRTRELARSNEDLERFAFGASHDLQAPLRMLESHGRRLAAHNLDPECRTIIASMSTEVSRMRTLIQDLLEFARAGSDNVRDVVQCDCTVVLQLALEYLASRVAETRAEVSFDALPVLMINETRLLRVFQNLVGNALQYCRAEPRIHISAQRAGDSWIFSIRDNGIGIAPEYQVRVFGLFQRLHSQSEYSGSGIGLAVVKRIIESCGGSIWLESEVGKGSTFYFSLPVVEVPAATAPSAARTHRA